jgi:hypothetical protein
LTLRRGALANREGHSAGLKGVLQFYFHYTGGEYKVSKFQGFASFADQKTRAGQRQRRELELLFQEKGSLRIVVVAGAGLVSGTAVKTDGYVKVVLGVEIEPGVRVGPFEFGDRAGELDPLVDVEFGGEGVVRACGQRDRE